MQLAGKLQDNLVILPSSIHEVIILPEREAPSEGEAAAMVREVNDTELLPEEVLSNHVYRFDLEKGEVCIAA